MSVEAHLSKLRKAIEAGGADLEGCMESAAKRAGFKDGGPSDGMEGVLQTAILAMLTMQDKEALESALVIIRNISSLGILELQGYWKTLMLVAPSLLFTPDREVVRLGLGVAASASAFLLCTIPQGVIHAEEAWELWDNVEFFSDAVQLGWVMLCRRKDEKGVFYEIGDGTIWMDLSLLLQLMGRMALGAGALPLSLTASLTEWLTIANTVKGSFDRFVPEFHGDAEIVMQEHDDTMRHIMTGLDLTKALMESEDPKKEVMLRAYQQAQFVATGLMAGVMRAKQNLPEENLPSDNA